MRRVAVLPARAEGVAAHVGAGLAGVLALAGGRVVCLDLDPVGEAWRRLLPPGDRPPPGLVEVLLDGGPLGACLRPVLLRLVGPGPGVRRAAGTVHVGGCDSRFPLDRAGRARLRPGALAACLASRGLRWWFHAALVVTPALPDVLAERAAAELDRVLVIVPCSGDAPALAAAVARRLAGLRPSPGRAVRYVLAGAGDPTAEAAHAAAMRKRLAPWQEGAADPVSPAVIRLPRAAWPASNPPEETAVGLVALACDLERTWRLLGCKRRRLAALARWMDAAGRPSPGGRRRMGP